MAEKATLDDILKGLNQITEGLASLGKRVNKLEDNRSEKPPLTMRGSPTERIRELQARNLGVDEYSSNVNDTRFPGTKARYISGDIIQLANGSEKATAYRQGASQMGTELPEVIMGVVQRQLAVSEGSRQMKYLVTIPGIGRDGIEEGELELVEAANRR